MLKQTFVFEAEIFRVDEFDAECSKVLLVQSNDHVAAARFARDIWVPTLRRAWAPDEYEILVSCISVVQPDKIVKL